MSKKFIVYWNKLVSHSEDQVVIFSGSKVIVKKLVSRADFPPGSAQGLIEKEPIRDFTNIKLIYIAKLMTDKIQPLDDMKSTLW